MTSPLDELETVTEQSAIGRILTDHAALRHAIGSVLEAATDAIRDEKAVARLRSGIAELGVALLAHLDLEERVLLPVLSTLDPAFEARLRAEHVEQRIVVAAMLEDARGGVRTTRELVDEARWFLHSLERDIRTEERELFASDALAEDELVAPAVAR